jgi:hypothetical protein
VLYVVILLMLVTWVPVENVCRCMSHQQYTARTPCRKFVLLRANSPAELASMYG